MKKLIFFPTVLLGISILNNTQSFAQNNSITISISGIEYENANLTSLKEALKKTPKVTGVKSSYTNAEASFSVSYSGTAEELWDKIPTFNKKNFKLSSMTDENIILSYVSPSKTITPSKQDNNQQPAKNTNAKKADNGCKSCVYFPICDYDYTKTFQGKEYKGIDYDGTIVYYRYENGDLITKTERFNEWGASLGFLTETKLKCNASKGVKWQTNAEGDIYNSKQYEILGKGISLVVNSEQYNDVMKVSETTAMGSTTFYYAKDIGLIKEENSSILGDLFSEMINKDVNAEMMTSACKKFCGSWKLIEENGKSTLANEIGDYMQILDEGDASFFKLRKAANGKLYLSGSFIPADWSAYIEGKNTNIYIKRSNTEGKGTLIEIQSIAKKIIIMGTKKYEYVGDDITFYR